MIMDAIVCIKFEAFLAGNRSQLKHLTQGPAYYKLDPESDS